MRGNTRIFLSAEKISLVNSLLPFVFVRRMQNGKDKEWVKVFFFFSILWWNHDPTKWSISDLFTKAEFLNSQIVINCTCFRHWYECWKKSSLESNYFLYELRCINYNLHVQDFVEVQRLNFFVFFCRKTNKQIIKIANNPPIIFYHLPNTFGSLNINCKTIINIDIFNMCLNTLCN